MKVDPTVATRQSMLERLKRLSDQQSWQDFFNRYWRLIYSSASKAGLNDAEAQEVVQDTVICVARKIEGFTYDPKVASFKTWLMRITRFRILKQFSQRHRKLQQFPPPPNAPDSADPFAAIPDPASIDLESVWEQEWQRNLYYAAIDEVKKKVSPGQFQLFDLTVTQQWPVPKVAATLEVSPAKVYLAKHRVSRLIEKAVRRLESGALAPMRSYLISA